MLKRFCISTLLLLPFLLFAEETNFQRLDLVREENKLKLEGIFSYYMQNISGFDRYTFLPQLGIEYIFKNHAVRSTLPYTISLLNNKDARRQVFYGFGDLTLNYEYLKQIRNLNLFFGGSWGIPLSETNEYKTREGILATGTGRHNLGLNVGITGIKDPVVWNAGLKYTFGLPKEERFFWSFEPANIQANAGITTMFNDTFGLSFNLLQTIRFPQVKDGIAKTEELRTSTIFRPEALILSEDWYVRISLDIYGYPLNMPFIVTLSYGYSFEFPKKKNP